MANEITVKGAAPQNEDGSFPVAIWDKDEAYKDMTAEDSEGNDVDLPDGELYIADDKEHSVPVTPAVSQALNEGRLVEIRGGKPVVRGAEQEEEAKAPAPATTKK
jgi:hypothetical protein